MYTTRIITADEKERYNDFVRRHPKGHFLQSWEWGQVKKGMGWTPLPLVLEQDGEIQASVLLLKRPLPLPGVKKSIFYSPRGPVMALDNPALARELFAGARTVGRQQGAIFLKIDPDVPVSDLVFAGLLKDCGFAKNETGLDFEGVQPSFVFRLDITPSEEKLLADMHSKTRYNIRLAEKKGVQIRKASDRSDLRRFYDVLTETAIRDNFLIRGYEYFEMIWEQMVENDMGQVFLAEWEGKLVAATLAMCMGNKAWYLYGASSNQYRNVMPNYLIQWSMIRWARERGCTMYDFRGVSGDLDESNPLYGLYKFKKGFNGEFTEFIGDLDTVYDPFFYFLWTKALPVYRKSTRRLLAKRREAGEA